MKKGVKHLCFRLYVYAVDYEHTTRREISSSNRSFKVFGDT